MQLNCRSGRNTVADPAATVVESVLCSRPIYMLYAEVVAQCHKLASVEHCVCHEKLKCRKADKLIRYG